MLKRASLVAAAAALLLASSYATSSNANNGKVVIPIDKVNATDGKQMYGNYCAPCHGLDGRGHGPVANDLKTAPVDLTLLEKNNHGKFPDTHVVAVLQFGVDLPAHGSALMPVWGPVLGKISNVHTQEKTLRIANLSRYLQSIQAK